MRTHYELLHVTRASTIEEIRAAYVKFAKLYHPDAGGNADEFTQINQAYKTLCDPKERIRYNLQLDTLHKRCLSCAGKGVIAKQKSFKERTFRTCVDCGGSGCRKSTT